MPVVMGALNGPDAPTLCKLHRQQKRQHENAHSTTMVSAQESALFAGLADGTPIEQRCVPLAPPFNTNFRLGACVKAGPATSEASSGWVTNVRGPTMDLQPHGSGIIPAAGAAAAAARSVLFTPTLTLGPSQGRPERPAACAAAADFLASLGYDSSSFCDSFANDRATDRVHEGGKRKRSCSDGGRAMGSPWGRGKCVGGGGESQRFEIAAWRTPLARSATVGPGDIDGRAGTRCVAFCGFAHVVHF